MKKLAPTLCLVVALCVIQGTLISEKASQLKEVNADASMEIYESRIVTIVDDIHASRYIAKEEIVDIVEEEIPIIDNDLGFQPYNISLPSDVQLYTNEQCEKYGWSINLVYAIMAQESKFDANAIHTNKDGTMDGGLMQINDWLASRYYELTGIEANVDNPYDNIDMGIWLMNYLRDKFKDGMSEEQFTFFLLTAYNAGEDDAIELGLDCQYFDYTQEVLDYKYQLDQYKEVITWH